MQVMVNGKMVETGALVLSDLVTEYAQAGGRIATAVNGDFIPAGARSDTRLKPGDRIEIVSPRQGG